MDHHFPPLGKGKNRFKKKDVTKELERKLTEDEYESGAFGYAINGLMDMVTLLSGNECDNRREQINKIVKRAFEYMEEEDEYDKDVSDHEISEDDECILGSPAEWKMIHSIVKKLYIKQKGKVHGTSCI